MEKILSLEQLESIAIKVKSNDFPENKRIKAKVVVHLGTCGISAGANEILKTDMLSMGTASHDEQMSFRIFRNATSTRDTYPADAHFLESIIYYQAYRLGDENG